MPYRQVAGALPGRHRHFVGHFDLQKRFASLAAQRDVGSDSESVCGLQVVGIGSTGFKALFLLAGRFANKCVMAKKNTGKDLNLVQLVALAEEYNFNFEE